MQSNYTIQLSKSIQNNQLFYSAVNIMVRQIAHHKTYKHRNSNYQIHTIQHSKTQNNVQVSPEYSITKHISLT